MQPETNPTMTHQTNPHHIQSPAKNDLRPPVNDLKQ